MHHHVTLVSRRVHRKLLSTRAFFEALDLPYSVVDRYRRRATRLYVSIVFLTRRKIDSVISRRYRKREREKRWSDRNAKQLKWLHVKHLSATLRHALPSFLLSLSSTRPFYSSLFDDTVVSPITHHGSIVNQNAALSGTKVPNKIHKFPPYCARSGFRQKFPKFRK